MVNEDRLVQPSKALVPMEVTEKGMVTETRLVQPSKALLPMDVTDEEILTVVSLRQPLKADPAMLLPDTIVTLVRLEMPKIEIEANDAGTIR